MRSSNANLRAGCLEISEAERTTDGKSSESDSAICALLALAYEIEERDNYDDHGRREGRESMKMKKVSFLRCPRSQT